MSYVSNVQKRFKVLVLKRLRKIRFKFRNPDDILKELIRTHYEKFEKAAQKKNINPDKELYEKAVLGIMIKNQKVLKIYDYDSDIYTYNPRRKSKIKNKSEYHKYLQSEAWKEIREIILVRDGYKCTKCGSTKNLQVHHKTYNNIYNEKEHQSDLVTLCSRCHKKEHNIEL